MAEWWAYSKIFQIHFGEKGNDLNRIVQNNVLGRAGNKPKQKKHNRGQNNIRMEPIVTYRQNYIPERLLEVTDTKKLQTFTYYNH